MNVLAKPTPNGGDSNVVGLRSLIEECRTELRHGKRTVRQAGEDGLERRLEKVALRLESAVEAFARAVQGQASGAVADVLAREADHRIKNNLQTVIALLHQQGQRADSEPVREAVQAAAARVQAITSLHESLYGASNVVGLAPQIDLGHYLPSLCAALAEAVRAESERREVLADVDALLASPKRAQSLGLIVTELATNALRHAFAPGRAGTVWVSGRAGSDGGYEIVVRDDGRGLPAGFDLRARGSGLGLRVVSVLVDQVQGRLRVDGQAGARFRLTLPRE